MLDIFIKLIATVFVVYGAVWLVTSGHLVKPFVDSGNEGEGLPPTREIIGLAMSFFGTLVVTVSLIAIVWLI